MMMAMDAVHSGRNGNHRNAASRDASTGWARRSNQLLRWLGLDVIPAAAPAQAWAMSTVERRPQNRNLTHDLEQRQKRTVLIIDDEQSFRSLVFRLLHGLEPHLRVEKAQNGVNVRRQISRYRPDLVVINVVELDAALALCRLIREDPGTRGTRVLVISDANKPPTIGRIYDAGADLCLIRPLQFKQFRQEVTRLLDEPPLR
jgi:PleD family two-component response regulator